LAQELELFERFHFAPLIMVGAYLLGGLVIFPVTVLSASVALIFPPLKAVSISLTGMLSSSALLYWMGRGVLGRRLKSAVGPTVKRLEEKLNDQGIVTIAALRMTPIAPFTLVNIAAGAMGIRFRDYMLGTLLGLAPGVILICLFGNRVRAFWRHPSGPDVWVAVAVGVVWIAIVIALQRWAASHHRRRGSGGGGRPKASAPDAV
jgi:phospholipase D1/2